MSKNSDKVKFQEPVDLNELTLDLEIDLAEFGGMNRFEKLSDLSAWLEEERKFWNWTKEAVSADVANRLHQTISQFWTYADSVNNQIRLFSQQYGGQRESTIKLLGLYNEGNEQIKSSLISTFSDIEKKTFSFIAQVKSHMENEIIHKRNHFTRTEPQSLFVDELAEQKCDEAIYALDQLLKIAKDSRNNETSEHSGRVLATLYDHNLNRKVRFENKAFKNAQAKWDKELLIYKEKYDSQLISIEEVKSDITTTKTDWKTTKSDLQTLFDDFIDTSKTDFSNLKDTYEIHMQLQAPVKYWKAKKKNHESTIKLLTKWCVFTSFIVLCVILGSLYLLPHSGFLNEIPWRPLGLVLVVSTFSIWIVKFIIKLLLSNIHLRADAEEREVMASTFMALVRHKDGEKGLSKDDVAIILAPLFRPSTTGVISDEHGPASLTDIITRMGGKS